MILKSLRVREIVFNDTQFPISIFCLEMELTVPLLKYSRDLESVDTYSEPSFTGLRPLHLDPLVGRNLRRPVRESVQLLRLRVPPSLGHTVSLPSLEPNTSLDLACS